MRRLTAAEIDELLGRDRAHHQPRPDRPSADRVGRRRASQDRVVVEVHPAAAVAVASF